MTLGDYTYIFNAFAAEQKFFTCGDPRGGLTYAAMRRAAKDLPEVAERVRFYDNRTDPEARHNRIKEEDKKLKIMLKMLLDWMQEKEDPLLSYYQDYLEKSNP